LIFATEVRRLVDDQLVLANCDAVGEGRTGLTRDRFHHWAGRVRQIIPPDRSARSLRGIIPPAS
jgi:hypothetical protein